MVISIVVMLVALLLPAVQGARKQAAATVCQARVRQWGILFQTEAAAYQDQPFLYAFSTHWSRTVSDDRFDSGRVSGHHVADEMFLCPMASRLEKDNVIECPDLHTGKVSYQYWGTTFTASWSLQPDGSISGVRSYGCNSALQSMGASASLDAREKARNPIDAANWLWPATVKGSTCASVPVFFDGIASGGLWESDKDSPPPYEDMSIPKVSPENHWWPFCINRHNGGVNYLFLDWSVRKMGLKELWTLKWNKDFSTTGPWTRAGGVAPEDWPPWMRKFKDY